MQTSFLVVDDFHPNPDELRRLALSFDYPEQKGQFPGRNSQQRLEVPGLTEMVSNFVAEPLVPAPRPLSHAKFRRTLGSDEGLGRVHIDSSYWSGILYLSRPDDCQGGTEFFRHRATGSDRFPVTQSELAATGYASFEEAHKRIIEGEGTTREAWEHLMTIPMRYNRLLLLRPWLYHTAGPGFGDRPENARLVYLMFYLAPNQG